MLYKAEKVTVKVAVPADDAQYVAMDASIAFAGW
jgi:hypothetical protein